MGTDARTPAELDELEARIDRWLADQLAENPMVAAVEPDVAGSRRWFVRVLGEQKDVFTIRFHLRQRTLAYETYLMPAPIENHGELYEHLLRRNIGSYGVHLAIGEEDAVYLVGQLPNQLVSTDDELDRVLGSLYEATERWFRPAMRIGYASKFT